MFIHNEFNLVIGTNVQKYNGNIYNLAIKNDETYITDIGIVHNCRCRGDQVDDMYLKDSNTQISKGSEYLEKEDPTTGKPYVDEQFRYCPANQIMPNTGGYFEVLSSANKANANLFDYE
jgi:hypothetical protein